MTSTTAPQSEPSEEAEKPLTGFESHPCYKLPRIPPYTLVRFLGHLSGWPDNLKANHGFWEVLGIKHLGTEHETYLCRRPVFQEQGEQSEPYLEAPRWLQESGGMMALTLARNDKFSPNNEQRVAMGLRPREHRAYAG